MPDAAYHPLMRSVTAALRRRCGVGEGDRVLVAVSGGPDSVALLRALLLLAPRRRWRLDLHVAHVQHGLREEASAKDERFVAALAARFGLPLHRADAAIDAARNVEALARRARLDALAEIARAAEIGRVATGHHADDQLETLLLMLLRGKRAERLRGMAWRRRLEAATRPDGPWLIRPMLGVTRADVLGFLDAIGQGWREDASNADARHPRNRLRRDVTPVLRELNPRVAQAAVELTDALRRRLR